MYNIITIIALLALITRQIEAQSVLATACYFKRDSEVLYSLATLVFVVLLLLLLFAHLIPTHVSNR
jgi:hypothetical protein